MSKANLKKEKKKADSSFSDTSDDENLKKNQSGVKKTNDSDESDLWFKKEQTSIFFHIFNHD